MERAGEGAELRAKGNILLYLIMLACLVGGPGVYFSLVADDMDTDVVLTEVDDFKARLVVPEGVRSIYYNGNELVYAPEDFVRTYQWIDVVEEAVKITGLVDGIVVFEACTYDEAVQRATLGLLAIVLNESRGDPLAESSVAAGLAQVVHNGAPYDFAASRPSRDYLLDPVNNLGYASELLLRNLHATGSFAGALDMYAGGNYPGYAGGVVYPLIALMEGEAR